MENIWNDMTPENFVECYIFEILYIRRIQELSTHGFLLCSVMLRLDCLTDVANVFSII